MAVGASDRRHDEQEPVDGPVHPTLRAALLMAAVVLALLVLSVSSVVR